MSVRRIAQKANVSIATVSRVFRDGTHVAPETRQRVLQAASQIGYSDAVPSEASIGLVFAYADVFSDYDRLVLDGIRSCLGEQHIDVRIIEIDRDKQPQESFTEFFLRKGVRGVVLRSVGRARQVCLDIAEEKFPHVLLADALDEPTVNYVVCDCREESLRAVEHLIELGHQRIAFATHGEADQDHICRLSAYQEAHRKAGLALDPKLIIQSVANLRSGAAALNQVLSLQDPPTAIVLADPALTAGVVRRASEIGLSIPAELSVVGFDDGEMRQMFHPRITAVCQDCHRLGELAAAALLEVMSGASSTPVRRVIRATFEVNGSTGLATANPVRVLPSGTRVTSETTAPVSATSSSLGQ